MRRFAFSFDLPVGAAAAAMALLLTGCSGSSNSSNPNLVYGGTQSINGRTAITWAQLDSGGTVTAAGVDIPAQAISSPPAAGGSGPLGAFLVIPFPSQAQQTTFLNHFELHWNPMGHEPEGVYDKPHFDFHFYAIPEAEVRQVGGPDPQPPAADRIPAGYIYPGPEATVPQMGVHAAPVTDFGPTAPPFTSTMILGYYNGRMTFVEPMVTQQKLLQRQDFTLQIPTPPVLGRATRYPTKAQVQYMAATNMYRVVLSDFASVQ